MEPYHVIFYQTITGEEPAKEFVLNLSYEFRAKVIRSFKLLQDNGPAIREPDSKELEDGIFELRVEFAGDIVRVLYFFDKGKLVVLTNGFVKKSQKNTKGRNCPCKEVQGRLPFQKGDFMTSLNDLLEEQLKDPKFKEAYDALEPEYALKQAIIDARTQMGMTQMELSRATGIPQADISRLENGNGNPSLKTMQKLAKGMGKQLKIEFV